MEVSINSVNPDRMPQNVAHHLVLNCLKINFLKCGPDFGQSCLQKCYQQGKESGTRRKRVKKA